jgi:hypothetical protein
MAFVRFVVDAVDEDSGHRLGVFNAAASLRDRGELSADELKVLAEVGRWLDVHLPRPTRFTRKRNDSHRRPRALSWFKDSASSHIARMREICELLTARGVLVHTIFSDRPGYIVYEDDVQVVAEPFADSGA